MAEVRDKRQRERAEAREGRRSHADEPEQRQRNESSVDLRRAAATAVTAALVGALAGALKSVADRRSSTRQAEPEADDTADDTQDEDERSQADPPHDEDRTDEPEATEDPEDVADSEQDGEEEDDDHDEHDEHDEHEQDDSEQTGAPSGQIASIVTRAKEHAESVLGAEAESVSGVSRSNGKWHVDVEVVQMRRIPESTDILASYAVVLDGDGDLISVQEQRRYRRSQADDDR